MSTPLRYTWFAGLAVLVAACGESTAPPPGGIGNSDWEQGVFERADKFEARCEAPRSGTNPATNKSFPDVQGTTTDENQFLRSYSNETYLWYDEIVDQDPGRFSDPISYFERLRTEAITPSGAPKDKFHFTVDSAEWFALSQSGVAAGYGAQWIFLSSTPPREVLVAYTEPGSPATDPQVDLARGAKILEVDGLDIDAPTQDEIDTLNAALFPAVAGETHTFTIQDSGSEQSRTVTMTSANIESAPVQKVRVLETPTGRVGYFLFNDHIATAELGLVNAVKQLNAGEGIDDLVLDMRYNGGGFLALASELAYMIAGPEATDGRTFELVQFNDKHPKNDPVTGRSISPTPFYDTSLGPPFNAPADEALPTLDLPRVFILTGPNTCSASEAVINGLRGVDVEVIQIGSTTCGKPYGFYPRDNCGTTYFTIQFKGVNDKGFAEYTDGFSPANTEADAGALLPGCSVPDDFSAALGNENETRLAAALSYRETGTCPPELDLGSGVREKSGARPNVADGLVVKSPWLTNRILWP